MPLTSIENLSLGKENARPKKELVGKAEKNQEVEEKVKEKVKRNKEEMEEPERDSEEISRDQESYFKDDFEDEIRNRSTPICSAHDTFDALKFDFSYFCGEEAKEPKASSTCDQFAEWGPSVVGKYYTNA